MKVFSTLQPTQRWNLFAIFVAGLCFWTGFTGLTPVLPLYIEQFGASGQEIGLVMTSFAFGLLLIRPLTARMTDERGRKPVMLIGLLMVAVAPLLFWAVSFMPNVVWHLSFWDSQWNVKTSILFLFVFRTLHGLSIAAFVTTYSVLVADISPPNQRGQLIALMGLVNPIGTGLGPTLGGYLRVTLGYAPVFVFIAGLGAIGLACASRISETYRIKIPSQRKKVFWALVLQPSVRTPALVLMFVGLAFGSMMVFLPLYARESNLSINVGLFYAASAVCSFLVQLWVGAASDRYGRGRFITIALVFYILSMSSLWIASNKIAVFLAVSMEGIGGGMLMPMVESLMADRSSPSERGLMFGLCLVGFDVGIALAGPLMGCIADLTSYRDIFGVSALIVSLSLMVFLAMSSKDLKHSLSFSLKGGKDVFAVPLSSLQ